MQILWPKTLARKQKLSGVWEEMLGLWKDESLCISTFNQSENQRMEEESENEREVNEYCLTLESELGSEEINAQVTNASD